MIDLKPALDELHADLGYRRLNLAWAKVEILLGLFAVGVGQVLLLMWSRSPERQWAFLLAGVALFTLGGYLALAGHRSHLYQASNDRTAYLLEKLRGGGSSSGSR